MHFDVRCICIPFTVGLETKCGKSAEPTIISCSEKPLEKPKSKAATKAFEEQSNLFSVYKTIRLSLSPVHKNTLLWCNELLFQSDCAN